jgi:Flp pilus assembly protein CpaB
MKLSRILCASAIAAGVAFAGALGAGIATANAAPAPATPTVKPVSNDKIKPTQHQKKEIGKQAEKQAKHRGLTVS